MKLPLFLRKKHSCIQIIKLFVLVYAFDFGSLSAQVLIHTENFSSSIPSGWTTTSLASADNWSLTNGTSPCEGSYGARLSANSCAQDDWIFSKGFTCTKDYRYSITYKADNTATMNVYAGNAQTTGAMTSGTTMLSSSTDYNCADVSTTTSFSCLSTGTYYFAFRVRGNCGTAKIDNIRFYETAPITHTWNGSVDTDWSNASNWSNGVPSRTGIAVIPQGQSNYPVVNDEIAQCKNLTIDNGASISVSSSNSSYYLEINGDLIIDGTLNFSGSTPLYMKGSSSFIDFTGALSTATKFSFEDLSSYTINNSIVCNSVTIASLGALTVADSQILQLTSFSNSGTFTLNTNALLKITSSNFSFVGTNNLTNGTVEFAQTSGDITIPNGTYNDLTIYTINGATTTLGSSLIINGVLTIVNPGLSGGVIETSGDLTIGGNFDLGTSGNALTLNLGHQINTIGAFNMGNNSSHIVNISYSSSSLEAITASNSGSFVFYGSVIYSSSSEQIVMRYTYNGPIISNSAGNRYMAGNLDFNNNFTMTSGKWYSGSPETLTIGTGSGTDNNQKSELSPYQGQKKSARWQMLLSPSELSSIGANDLLTSLSFYVTSKNSENAFENFTIKLGHTSSTKFQNSVPSYFLNDATTTVFASQSVTTTTGWNTHTFDTPFTWNGSSYVLVNISFDNTVSGIWPDNAATSPDAVSYTTGVFGADALIRAEGNTSQVTQTDGVNSDDKTYTLLNSIDGPFNINITNEWLNTGCEFYHMNNTVTFDGASNQDVTSNGDKFYNYTVNNSGTGLTLIDNCIVENTATLTGGVISTGSNTFIVESTLAANLAGYSSASFIYGNLRRYIISNTSTYGLPLGNGTGTSNYYPSDIINSNLTSTSYLDAKFVNGLPADYNSTDFVVLNKQATGAGVSAFTLTSLDSKGYIQIDPDIQPTGGSYSMKLYNSNYSLGAWEDNKQVIMKRASSSSSLNDFNMAGAINADNGAGRLVSDGYLLSSGLTSFSIFVPAGGGAAPLPVNLLDFSGKRKNDFIELNWITSSEMNNDYFVINKIEFNSETPVAIVQGAGNSNSILNYSCFDKNPKVGYNYYQLTQRDYDGKFEKSSIIAVYFIDKKSISVYPNPSTSFVNVNFGNIEADYLAIDIFDMFGQNIFHDLPSVVNSEYRIDTKGFGRGIYLLNLKTDNNILYSEKIIIN